MKVRVSRPIYAAAGNASTTTGKTACPGSPHPATGKIRSRTLKKYTRNVAIAKFGSDNAAIIAPVVAPSTQRSRFSAAKTPAPTPNGTATANASDASVRLTRAPSAITFATRMCR